METIELSEGTLQIIEDDSPESPREWDNLGTMVCFHRNYNLGDKHEYRSQEYQGWDEMEKAIRKNEDVALLFPVYLYDHSGITISITPFSCPWDSGQIGFIFVSKEKVRKEYGVKNITKKTLEKVKRCLLGEVQVYAQFLQGDVWGYVIKDKEGDVIDSCWGFYGSDPLENGMIEHWPENVVKKVTRMLT